MQHLSKRIRLPSAHCLLHTQYTATSVHLSKHIIASQTLEKGRTSLLELHGDSWPDQLTAMHRFMSVSVSENERNDKAAGNSRVDIQYGAPRAISFSGHVA